MTYPKIPLAQTIVALSKIHKLDTIVISPGSRNAPLTIGFTSDDYFKCHSIVDERCAAFFALGLAQQLKKPTILVCTSGSALLNYYPAIAEAYYSQIPLIVLSADRPKHLVNNGDGQTIYQVDVYGKHVVYSSNLKLDIEPTESNDKVEELPIFKSLENKLERFLGIQKGIQEFNEVEINKAFNLSVSKMGPVHLNVPFDEPLYETTNILEVSPKKTILVDDEIENLDDEKITDLVSQWNKADRKMILVGVLEPNTIEVQLLSEILADPSVTVFAETTSNLHHPRLFGSIDKVIDSLSKDEFETLKPQLLITFGGMVVSKKIKKFLREFQPQQHWHIGENRANDTYFKLREHIKVRPNIFLNKVQTESSASVLASSGSSNYFQRWNTVRLNRNLKHDTFLNTAEYSDLKVFDFILKTIPDKTILQLANSSVIRYTQLFDLNPSLEVFCNRGTSGIDGSTSTAIGCAVARQEPTLLITGDLSFLYDSNALWNSQIPNSFRIIIINNGGGGIFRIISPNRETEKFSEYFETHHNYNTKHLAEMYGFEYDSANDWASLRNTVSEFYQASGKPKILEVFTPRKLNEEVLKAYFKFIATN